MHNKINGTKNRWDKYENMKDLNNHVNMKCKCYEHPSEMVILIIKADATIYCLQETLQYKDINRLKWKGWGKNHVNTNWKLECLFHFSTFLSNIISSKEGHFIILRGQFIKKKILNVYASKMNFEIQEAKNVNYFHLLK